MTALADLRPSKDQMLKAGAVRLTSMTPVRGPESRAFFSLILTLRRISWQNRRWAWEDEAAGRLEAYRKHAAEARRTWRSAKWHINHLRNCRSIH